MRALITGIQQLREQRSFLNLLLKESVEELREHEMNDIEENALDGDEEERGNVSSARTAFPGRIKACVKLLTDTFGKGRICYL